MQFRIETHHLSLAMFCRFGRDWKRIEAFVATKTAIQVGHRLIDLSLCKIINGGFRIQDRVRFLDFFFHFCLQALIDLPWSIIQIRSHAQKHFLKARKFGLAGGLPPPLHPRRATLLRANAAAADMMPPPWLPSAGGGSIGCSAPPSGVQQSMAGRSPACYSTDEASFRPLIHSSECSTVHLNISACFLKIKLQLTLKLIEQMTMTVHSSRHQTASDQVANHGSVMMPSSCRMKQFGSQFLQVRTDSSLACCIVAVNESNFFKSAFLSCVITHFLISDLCIFLFCR